MSLALTKISEVREHNWFKWSLLLFEVKEVCCLLFVGEFCGDRAERGEEYQKASEVWNWNRNWPKFPRTLPHSSQSASEFQTLISQSKNPHFPTRTIPPLASTARLLHLLPFPDTHEKNILLQVSLSTSISSLLFVVSASLFCDPDGISTVFSLRIFHFICLFRCFVSLDGELFLYV